MLTVVATWPALAALNSVVNWAGKT